jgi:transposase
MSTWPSRWTSVAASCGETVVATTAAGNRELLAWARSLGADVRGFAVEGTGSYGASLTRCPQDAGEFVIEAGRPARRGDRQQRRTRGKTDTLDAHRAARSLLAEELVIAPKRRDGDVECLRILLVVKRGAVKARTQAVQGMRALMVSGPDVLRDQLRACTMDQLIDRCARLRPPGTRDVGAATKSSLRHLARRCRHLTEEIDVLDAEILRLVQSSAPNLLALTGVGPSIAAVLLTAAGENPGRMRSEASFAHMTGVAPLPTGSGLTSGRHRLNKGGDRQANNALWAKGSRKGPLTCLKGFSTLLTDCGPDRPSCATDAQHDLGNLTHCQGSSSLLMEFVTSPRRVAGPSLPAQFTAVPQRGARLAAQWSDRVSAHSRARLSGRGIDSAGGT